MQNSFESLRWVISSHFVYCTLICPAEKQTNTFFPKNTAKATVTHAHTDIHPQLHLHSKHIKHFARPAVREEHFGAVHARATWLKDMCW